MAPVFLSAPHRCINIFTLTGTQPPVFSRSVGLPMEQRKQILHKSPKLMGEAFCKIREIEIFKLHIAAFRGPPAHNNRTENKNAILGKVIGDALDSATTRKKNIYMKQPRQPAARKDSACFRWPCGKKSSPARSGGVLFPPGSKSFSGVQSLIAAGTYTDCRWLPPSLLLAPSGCRALR